MRKYVIQHLKEPLPELAGMMFDPDDDAFCEAHAYAPIDSYVWDATGYKPEARAYAAWDEEGLHVLMCAFENEIHTEATQFNGDVYKDSCMEFFFQPLKDDPRYLNIEVNAKGVALIGLGDNRFGRLLMVELPESMNLQASHHRGGWWAVSYTLTTELIRDIFDRAPVPGDVMRGNFYKCDESIHPHFGSWAPIMHFQPDFHRPEWFGELELEPVSKL